MASLRMATILIVKVVIAAVKEVTRIEGKNQANYVFWEKIRLTADGQLPAQGPGRGM